MSRFMHMPDNPNPLGLVPDFEHDAFSLRIADEDVNRGIESWWRYRVSSGERLTDLEPELAVESEGRAREHIRLFDARAVPGTDLHLLHWWRADLGDFSQGYFREGAVFTLMSPDGSVAWRLDLPTDYTVEGDEAADDALERSVQEHGVIRSTSDPGRFVVWFVADGAQVSFQVERARDTAGGWTVEETARAPFSPPGDPERVDPPRIELVALGTSELKPATSAPASALRGVDAWAFDGGGFVAVRPEDQRRHVRVRLDAAASVIDERPFPLLPDDVAGDVDVTWVHQGGEDWLVLEQAWEPQARPRAWRADADAGLLEPLAGFAPPAVAGVTARLDQVAPLSDGGFVALGTVHLQFTLSSALVAFDADGRVRWVVEDDYEDPTKLFAPAPAGRISAASSSSGAPIRPGWTAGDGHLGSARSCWASTRRRPCWPCSSTIRSTRAAEPVAALDRGGLSHRSCAARRGPRAPRRSRR